MARSLLPRATSAKGTLSTASSTSLGLTSPAQTSGSYDNYGQATIDFTDANLAHADLSGSTLKADADRGDAIIDFKKASLAFADMSGSNTKLKADGYHYATIDFSEAKLSHAGLSHSRLTAESLIGATIDFTDAELATIDLTAPYDRSSFPQL